MVDLTFIEAQPWQIVFSAHDEDGAILPLTSGAEVELRINGLIGSDVVNLLTIGMDNGAAITDAEDGIAEFTITTEAQAAATVPITSDGIYFYEVRVALAGIWERQAEGRLFVDNSLFAAPVNILLQQFRARFPEFDDTPDGLVSMYIEDASAIVRLHDTLFASESGPLATLYYAAHLIQMRQRAASLASVGGIDTTGEVKSISVEDRTINFATSTSTRTSTQSSTSGLGSTIYGQRYLSFLLMYPRFIQRA